MDPVTLGLLVGGGQGLLQGMENRQKQAQDERTARAMMMYSPWTGMSPQKVEQRPGMMGSALSGAVAGGSFGQNLSNAQQGNEAMNKWLAMQQAQQTPVAKPIAAQADEQAQLALSPMQNQAGTWYSLNRPPMRY